MDNSNRQSVSSNEVSRTAKNKADQAKRSASKMADQVQDQVRDTAQSVSEIISERTQRLSEQLSDVSNQLRERADIARRRTSETVSRHPFYAISAAAIAGLTIGLLFSRNRH